MEIEVIKQWLMDSIWGIITLGALGSLFGALILFLLKKTFAKVNSSKDRFLRVLAYPIMRQNFWGEAMRKHIAPNSEDVRYLVYYVERIAYCIMDFVTFLVCVSFLGHVLIAYGLERPLLLSFLIAINILTLVSTLKSLMFSDGHQDEDIQNKREIIEKALPRKYADYESLGD
ncbi:hypothetical protein [Vibrio campbellii]|uniref:hypothetical protein n=1 Tax=Vibrio campbellii TaxID=680 RepID=UPI000B0E02AD|nr:hypothetical protein [Vibrio campbellii]NIY86118.1 hypothetical protein [Vibrio campbellii]NVK70814.1 hypothetical protein [Vibrio campbellii]